MTNIELCALGISYAAFGLTLGLMSVMYSPKDNKGQLERCHPFVFMLISAFLWPVTTYPGLPFANTVLGKIIKTGIIIGLNYVLCRFVLGFVEDMWKWKYGLVFASIGMFVISFIFTQIITAQIAFSHFYKSRLQKEFVHDDETKDKK